MDTPEVKLAFDCALCNEMEVTVDSSGPRVSGTVRGMQRHDLFHSACESCDQSTVLSPAKCCKQCQHLRVEHLMLCGLREETDVTQIGISWIKRTSIMCELCNFFANSLYNLTRKKLRLSILRISSLQKSFLQRGTEAFVIPDDSQQIVSEYIAWEWAKSWVKDLKEDLPDPVRFPRFTRASELRFDFTNQRAQSVLVVDVVQKCVVPLPFGTTYAALSYVWGAGLNTTQFQTSETNVRDLEQPGSLDHVRLPYTICDAMLVCKELDQRYLWVDRLCIIQDSSWNYKSVQLDQMALIYGQAEFTIVAAEGDSADFGLSGVSRPRITPEKAQLNDNIWLVEPAPGLEKVLARTTWSQRGWTFQEYLTSSRLLFFTQRGLYLSRRQPNSIKNEVMKVEEFAEAAIVPGRDPASTTGLRLVDLLSSYTKKSFTHSTDILRAITGILNAIYGERTSYGMPWKNLDLFILWCSRSDRLRLSSGSDLFPTWSWISINGQIAFPGATATFYSLVFWGTCTIYHSDSYQGQLWKPFAAPPNSNTTYLPDLSVAAVAWLSGCLLSEIPEWIMPDHAEYKSLKQQRNTVKRYHDAAFGSYSNYVNFDGIDIGLNSAVGKIAAHTQVTKFVLSSRYRDQSTGEMLLRACTTNRIAGAVDLNRRPPGKDNVVTLIALPVGTNFFGNPDVMIRNHSFHIQDDSSISKFYGCPCWLQQKEQTPQPHLTECPRHPDFWTPSLPRDAVINTLSSEPKDLTAWYQASNKYLSDVRDLGEHSHLTEASDEPPKLNVMLVTPSATQGGTITIYERLGIGQVYLKRWLEADPKFQTIILA
ncbi:heterokaryon incompatibility protein-domain-containing protein [Boeremia exigua]|uniref:heterokaryon incompatibility protein-domain-containing protein n=1 Tax=Boeremia exigua TaxID=749465 RepID=UPI001E8DC8A6|nr:heterokaryon incompatibility protein-domain-containing protein [Boeremia exigua]KAH6639191.1 heterokaryon incompatibility protein-domain-containing protein [Boeremia exigua]